MHHACLISPVPKATVSLPALFPPTADASRRFVEFFTANIRNPNTRKAWARAATQFATWCDEVGLTDLHDIGAVHVAADVETLLSRLAASFVKLHLAAIRMLFDWLTTRVPAPPAFMINVMTTSASTRSNAS